MTYTIQSYTLASGWVNCWTDIEPNGDETAVTFRTRDEAERELADFLEERDRSVCQMRIAELPTTDRNH